MSSLHPKSKKSILALLIMLELSGCATPAHQQPSPKLLSSAQALGLDGSALLPVEANWWQHFGDHQLDQLIQQGLDQSPGLAQAAARVREAQANVTAVHANSLPNIEANGLTGYGRSAKHYQTPPPIAGQVGSLGDVNMSLNWSIDLWGRTASLEAASQANVDASQMILAQSRLLLISAIVQTYIEYQRASTENQLAIEAIAIQQDLLHLQRLRVDMGIDNRDELEGATRKLAELRNNALRTQVAIQLAANTLVTLSGSSSADHVLASPHLNLAAGLILPEHLPVNLLARRPDIIAARLYVHADEYRQRAAIAAFYPTVDLQALAGFATFDISNLFHSSARNWSSAAAISLPIFDADRLRAAQHGVEAQRDGDIAAYNNTVLNAIQQCVDQLTQIATISDQQQQQRIATNAVEKSSQITLRRHKALLDGRLPSLRAELERIEMRRRESMLAADLALTQVRLLMAVGGSFDPTAYPLLTTQIGITQP